MFCELLASSAKDFSSSQQFYYLQEIWLYSQGFFDQPCSEHFVVVSLKSLRAT